MSENSDSAMDEIPLTTTVALSHDGTNVDVHDDSSEFVDPLKELQDCKDRLEALTAENNQLQQKIESLEQEKRRMIAYIGTLRLQEATCTRILHDGMEQLGQITATETSTYLKDMRDLKSENVTLRSELADLEGHRRWNVEENELLGHENLALNREIAVLRAKAHLMQVYGNPPPLKWSQGTPSNEALLLENFRHGLSGKPSHSLMVLADDHLHHGSSQTALVPDDRA
jgi:uncharacterized protein YdcH (DUF465 family)